MEVIIPSLIANYINAEELQNSHTLTEFTLQTLVLDAKKLSLCRIMRQMKWPTLSEYFTCQNHHSAVRKNIPLRILNTFNHENKGTLITSNANEVGIKTLCFRKCSLVNLEGRGLLGKTGVDARILELWVIMTLV
jgi:aspartokinase/homoserine dehydrogenase 1